MPDRGPGEMRPFHVCFVCSGNICRSPYAEAMLRRLAEERGLGGRLRVSSLGTLGIEGSPAHEWTIEAAAERGASLIPFRSRALDEARAAEADLIVALAREHLPVLREIVARLSPPPRLWLFSAPAIDAVPSPAAGLGPAGDAAGIPDPIGVEEKEYRRILAEIDEGLPALWAGIRGLLRP